jgi:multiple sugar transport system permease protein
VLVEFVLGFGLALLLLKEFRGRGLVTVFFLLPMMVVPAVSGFIFYMLFQQDGPINEALDLLFGIGPVSWLQDSSIAIWSVMVVDIWQWTPLMFLIFLSGLAALPEDQMNAARILGAGFRHQLRYLILPMMKPIILIALIIRAVEAFKMFDPIYLLTQGGPGEATTNISIYLFDETAANTRWGYASSVAILVLIFVSIVGFWAIRPIERAQEETMEELTGTEIDLEAAQPSVEEAIEAESKV